MSDKSSFGVCPHGAYTEVNGCDACDESNASEQLPAHLEPLVDAIMAYKAPRPGDQPGIHYGNVLGDGLASVTLVDHMGGDAAVIRAARVSYNGSDVDYVDPVTLQPTPKGAKLIRYLAMHKHTSPFRHAIIALRIKAPIFVARQMMTHQIGVARNEQSGRYTEFANEYYVPGSWRQQSTTNKQASSPEPFTLAENHNFSDAYVMSCAQAFSTYETLLANGVAKEMARMCLPMSTYTSWVWTMSLQAIAHFVALRTHEGAQPEVVAYANAIRDIALGACPVSFAALMHT